MDQIVLHNPVQTWLVAVLVVALGWLLGRLTRFVLSRWVVKLTAATGTNLDDKIIQRSARPVGLIVTFASVHVALAMLVVPDQSRHLIEGTVVAAIAITAAVIVMRSVDAVFEEVLNPWAARQNPPVNPLVLDVARIAIKVVCGSLATVTVMQRAGFDVWSVITGLGIGGVAVALAAQQTLGNLFGSVQVMTDRPFAVGDFVQIDRYSGRVQSVGLRSTRLKRASGEIVVIPNKHVAETTIENFMADQGQVREFTLALTYETAAERVEEACERVRQILAQQPGIHGEVMVHFWAFDESALRLRVIYRVPLADQFADIAHAVNMAILKDFAAAGLGFAYPVRRVIVDGPASAADAVGS